MSKYENRWSTVKVELEEGIAWVILNRPEKRNAMSPTLNREMRDVLEVLEQDAEARELVLTGAGSAWTAGMDLKEYFREVDAGPEILQERIRRDASEWQWKLLRMYTKPTIAMVNGWCFGGGFSPLVACDLAIAADEATFGLSEINWGIPPGNQGNGRYRRASSIALLHHDWQDFRWAESRRNGSGQQKCPAGPASR
jgi:trans-feruloyl-CoA hydratase/vanillin synthase